MAIALSLIHVIGIVAGFALLYHSFRLVRDRKEGIFEFLLWAGFGLGLLVISIGSALTTVDTFGTLQEWMGLLGLSGEPQSVFFITNLLLLFIVFYTYVELVESRKQLSDLNQEIALLRYDLDQRTDDEE